MTKHLSLPQQNVPKFGIGEGSSAPEFRDEVQEL